MVGIPTFSESRFDFAKSNYEPLLFPCNYRQSAHVRVQLQKCQVLLKLLDYPLALAKGVFCPPKKELGASFPALPALLFLAESMKQTSVLQQSHLYSFHDTKGLSRHGD